METTLHGSEPEPVEPWGGVLAVATRRESLILALLLSLAACLPYLVAVHPQLTDYPSHLARYYVMLEGTKRPFLERYYEFEWIWTGNLGADILVWPLAKLIGLERAGWLIGAIIPPLTGLGIVAVEWVLRRRVGVGGVLAFATIWSPAMGMGFYNFCLALALALFAFALWVRLERWRWRAGLFVPIGLAVWLCHMAGWGVLGLLVFGYEWHRSKSWRAFLAPWPLALPLLPILLAPAAGGALNYGRNPLIYKQYIALQALREQSFVLDVGTAAFILLLFAVAAFFRRLDGRIGWAALLLLIAPAVIPRHLGGGDYADYRLIAVALMVASLAVDWRVPRLILWLAPLPFLARLEATTEAWHRHSHQLEAALEALDHLPQGARVAGAVLVEGTWPLNPFEHAPSYATVRRDALVNSHFAVPGVHMLHLREGGKGFVDPSHRIFRRPDRPIDLTAFAPLKQADYLWYFGRVAPDRMPPGAKILHATRTSFLARLAKPASPR